MAEGVDIQNLRKEINARKTALNERKTALGEPINAAQSKDKFLGELLHSARTGKETNASIKIKTIDKVAEAKINKTTVDPSILQHVGAVTSTPSINETVATKPVMSSAEMARYNEQERIRKEGINPMTNQSNAGIADSMEKYMNIPPVGAPMNQNTGMLNEQQMSANLGGGASNQLIVEQVTNVATQLLNENFGKLYAEAMKNSIIESYKTEVVRASLEENRAMIKEIVIETILEIQKRNQSKK